MGTLLPISSRRKDRVTRRRVTSETIVSHPRRPQAAAADRQRWASVFPRYYAATDGPCYADRMLRLTQDLYVLWERDPATGDA
jgi:hypothetical protein